MAIRQWGRSIPKRKALWYRPGRIFNFCTWVSISSNPKTRSLFFFFIQNCIVPLALLSRKIRVAFPGESQLQQSRATQPTMHAGCLSVLHNPSNSDIDYRIFNVSSDVTACGCTRGCTDTVRVSVLKVDSGRKIPCRTEESNLPQRRAGPTLYQLSYIPTPSVSFKRQLKTDTPFLEVLDSEL